MLIFYFFLLILGLVVGSFLGVLVYRIPRGISILGRSVCDNCEEQIPWYQNIPLFYYIFSRGKCGMCGKSISPTYPFIEALTGASFVFTGYLWSGLSQEHGIAYLLGAHLGIFSLPLFLLLVSGFIALMIIDFEFQVLPDELLLPLGSAVFLALLSLPSPALFEHLFWGFLAFSFFLSIYLLTRERGMGFGDVKMSFLLGSLLGFPGAPVFLFLAFLTGALSGIILMLFGKARFGKPIPFGPYLLVSAVAGLFYGDIIWNWYMSLL